MVNIAVHDISKLEMGELQQQKTTSGCFWWWRIQELFANLLYNPSIVYPIVSLSLSPFTYSLSFSYGEQIHAFLKNKPPIVSEAELILLTN